jgi:small nuclear ribonucleoprotein (snRNP)-like protein
VGFLKAFDIHFNLLLTDVDEEYSINRRMGAKDAEKQGLLSSGELPLTLKRCDIVNKLILYSALTPICVADPALLSNSIFSDIRHLPQLLVRGCNVIFMSSYRKSCISYATMRNKLKVSRNAQTQGSGASVRSNLLERVKEKRTDPAPDSTQDLSKRRRASRGNLIVTGNRSSSDKSQGGIEDPTSGNSEQRKGSLLGGGPEYHAQRVLSTRAERETYRDRRISASVQEGKRDSVVHCGSQEQGEDLRYLDQDVKKELDRAIDSYRRSAGPVKTQSQRDRDDYTLKGKEYSVQATPRNDQSASKVRLTRDQTSGRKGLIDGHTSIHHEQSSDRDCLSRRDYRHSKLEDYNRDRERDKIDTIKDHNLDTDRDSKRDRDRVDAVKDHHPNRDRDRDRVDTVEVHHPNRDRDRDRVDTVKDQHPNRNKDRDQDRDRVDTVKDHYPNRKKDRDQDRDRVDTVKDNNSNRNRDRDRDRVDMVKDINSNRDRDRDRDRVDTVKDHYPNRDRDRYRDRSRTDS